MSGWWEDAVVYQVYPRSFQDSDGDGIGDLAGIASRLEHLEWLGVDALWLSPIYPSPLADYGYDVSDHAAIAPEYGTSRRLRRSARGGPSVAASGSCSTSSSPTPRSSIRWFREHPERYVWADGPEPPNNWLASFGGPAWSRDPERGQALPALLLPRAAGPRLAEPEVREAMGDVIRFWVERGVDGFRVDAVDRCSKDPALRDDPTRRSRSRCLSRPRRGLST